MLACVPALAFWSGRCLRDPVTWLNSMLENRRFRKAELIGEFQLVPTGSHRFEYRFMDSACAEEEESLALVDDFVSEINHALDSLEGWTPDTIVANYRVWSSKHLYHAVDGFAFLRRSGRPEGLEVSRPACNRDGTSTASCASTARFILPHRP
jgi:hypothetical protein